MCHEQPPHTFLASCAQREQAYTEKTVVGACRASFSQQEWMQITCLTTRGILLKSATASCCWCDPILSTWQRSALEPIPAHLVECWSHLQFHSPKKTWHSTSLFASEAMIVKTSVKQVAIDAMDATPNPDSWVSSPVWDQNHQVNHLRLGHVIKKMQPISIQTETLGRKESKKFTGAYAAKWQTKFWNIS